MLSLDCVKLFQGKHLAKQLLTNQLYHIQTFKHYIHKKTLAMLLLDRVKLFQSKHLAKQLLTKQLFHIQTLYSQSDFWAM